MKNANPKGYKLDDSIYIVALKEPSFRDGEQFSGCQRFRIGSGKVLGVAISKWQQRVVCVATVLCLDCGHGGESVHTMKLHRTLLGHTNECKAAEI